MRSVTFFMKHSWRAQYFSSNVWSLFLLGTFISFPFPSEWGCNLPYLSTNCTTVLKHASCSFLWVARKLWTITTIPNLQRHCVESTLKKAEMRDWLSNINCVSNVTNSDYRRSVQIEPWIMDSKSATTLIFWAYWAPAPHQYNYERPSKCLFCVNTSSILLFTSNIPLTNENCLKLRKYSKYA